VFIEEYMWGVRANKLQTLIFIGTLTKGFTSKGKDFTSKTRAKAKNTKFKAKERI